VASGNTLLIFKAQHNEPPVSNFAQPNTYGAQALVLDFADASLEFSCFVGVLPRNYAGGGLTVNPHVLFRSATTGYSHWGGAISRIADISSGGRPLHTSVFASAQFTVIPAYQSVNYVVVGSMGFPAGAAYMDSLSAGEVFKFLFYRNALHSTDNATGDVSLVAIEVRET
jgi:hypothetical protein